MFSFCFPDHALVNLQQLFRHVPGVEFHPRVPGPAILAMVPFAQTRLFEGIAAENPSLNCLAVHRRYRQGLNFKNGDRPIAVGFLSPADLILDRVAPGVELTCSYCFAEVGSGSTGVLPSLTFLKKTTSHIVSGRSLNAYASEVALNKIADANLDAGLISTAVEADGKTDLRWFVIRGARQSFPNGPFGLWNEGCSRCGGYAPRRYQFGEIYVRPEKSAHWMGLPHSPTAHANLLVSEQLYNWLLGPGSALLHSKAVDYALCGSVCGWYPEDSGFFFLPRHLQSESVSVQDLAVLPFMGFEAIPLLKSPKLEPAKWRSDALDQGLFRDLDQALNWEHDTVFILDLTSTDTDSISSEDIAKFRNLRELVLRHTKVQTLPDAVFHLKNLYRIDIRDTPIPPAEIERIRSQLPTRVKLVANRPRRTPS